MLNMMILDYRPQPRADATIESIFVRYQIIDEAAAPGQIGYGETTLTAPLLASFPTDATARVKAITDFIQDQAAQRHFHWLEELKSAPPPPLIIEQADVATLLGASDFKVKSYAEQGKTPSKGVDRPGQPQRKQLTDAQKLAALGLAPVAPPSPANPPTTK